MDDDGRLSIGVYIVALLNTRLYFNVCLALRLEAYVTPYRDTSVRVILGSQRRVESQVVVMSALTFPERMYIKPSRHLSPLSYSYISPTNTSRFRRPKIHRQLTYHTTQATATPTVPTPPHPHPQPHPQTDSQNPQHSSPYQPPPPHQESSAGSEHQKQPV